MKHGGHAEERACFRVNIRTLIHQIFNDVQITAPCGIVKHCTAEVIFRVNISTVTDQFFDQCHRAVSCCRKYDFRIIPLGETIFFDRFQNFDIGSQGSGSRYFNSRLG